MKLSESCIVRLGLIAIVKTIPFVLADEEGLIEFSPSVVEFYQALGEESALSLDIKPSLNSDTWATEVGDESDDLADGEDIEDYYDEDHIEDLDTFAEEEEDDDVVEDDGNDDKESNTNNDSQIPLSSKGFDYKNNKIIGVNLGGWLVTEPFISPSLYEQASSNGTEAGTPVDEYNYCKQLGPDVAHERLKKHWDTWITEADLIKIKSYGFNAVRLPIGYWAFARLHDDPYVFGQEEYLEKTITWCRAHGLKLWIDLHGIPGSQNGFDNSGRRDVLMWMNPEENYVVGMRVLKYIFDKYGGDEYSDVIIGYENLNEPLHGRYDVSRILQFDHDSYHMLREKSSNTFVYHDAFLPVDFWRTQLLEPEYQNTVIDHHRYEVFDTTQLRESVDGHITSMKLLVNEFKNLPKVQIIGEWSAALTDCTKWLNGVGRGARYDNTFAGTGFIGSCRFSNDYTKMTEQDRIDTRRIIEAQLDLYSETNGFFFWTWKTESSIEWSMSDLARIGLFPVPLTDRKYPIAKA